MNDTDNPFHTDGFSRLPMPGQKSRLVKHALKEPEKAFDFIDFLLIHRPLQKNLAMHLTHAATAGLWIKYEFKPDIIKKTPVITKDKPAFQPSDMWYDKLTQVREERIKAERQNNINIELDYYGRFLDRLKEFQEINESMESSRWNGHYTNAIVEWLETANKEYDRLKILAQRHEPITRNVFQTEHPLKPEMDKDTFLGRGDTIGELENKILLSRNMPIFLLHGQPGTGKTSFLKFLPHYLGPQFKTVTVDLQSIQSVFQWFLKLQKEFDGTMGSVSVPLPQDLENAWMKAWQLLQQHMEETTEKEEIKIILAFDNYEKIHACFREKPETAAVLLDEIRRFSLNQEKIAFLFAGTAFFSELKAPHWSNHFTQTTRLKIDYLDEENTLRLIDVPKLEYPEELTEHIYRLTQGHPALVQRICREMINIANRNSRRQLTMDDLETVLKNHIYVSDNNIMESFWKDFCRMGTMKATVRQIIAGEPLRDLRAGFTLSQHGYTIKKIDGLHMRVPIFQEWIELFGE
jgi:DNA polymerase III delta prime subunit